MIDTVALTISALSTGGALAAAAAERRSRAARSLGVRRACHELRGPITAVRLGVQLGARTGELSVDRLRALDLELGRAGLALEDLADPGSMLGPRRREPVDLRAVAEESVLAWSASAELHARELALRWRTDAVSVRGDRIRLAQILGNLLANAIEHGEGPITVTGRSGARRLLVEVRDEGPGLPAHVRTALAAPRARRPLSRAGRRGDPRHGHGLAIAAQIAALHGGSLTAAAGGAAGAAGPGARLVLELPLAT